MRDAEKRNQPTTTNHIPSTPAAGPAGQATAPATTSRTPMTRPAWAASRLARHRSWVQAQTPACRIRPPSSGEPGRMLNTASSDVDHGQPLEHGHAEPGDAEVVAGHRHDPGEHAEQQADERSDPRDPQLGAGSARVAADPGVAAHQPQHDAVHRKALVLGDDGVADLMDEDAGEERQSGDDAGRRVAQSRGSRAPRRGTGRFRGRWRGRRRSGASDQLKPTVTPAIRPSRTLSFIATPYPGVATPVLRKPTPTATWRAGRRSRAGQSPKRW